MPENKINKEVIRMISTKQALNRMKILYDGLLFSWSEKLETLLTVLLKEKKQCTRQILQTLIQLIGVKNRLYH